MGGNGDFSLKLTLKEGRVLHDMVRGIAGDREGIDCYFAEPTDRKAAQRVWEKLHTAIMAREGRTTT